MLPAAGHRAPPALVVPRLEAPGLAHLGLDDARRRGRHLDRRRGPVPAGQRPRGRPDPDRGGRLDARRCTSSACSDALPDARQTLAGPVMRELRMRKDAAEVARAARRGRRDRPRARPDGRVPARRAAPRRRSGRHRGRDRRGGARGGRVRDRRLRVPTARARTTTSPDRVIEAGDVVVIDIGGPLPSGYNSDSTRTYAVGREPSPEIREAYAVLQDAQERAVAAVRPGVTAEEVDAAARERSPRPGWGSGSSTAPGTASASTCTRSPTSSAATPGRWSRAWRSAWSPASTSTASGARASRTSSWSPPTAVERLNHRPRDLVVLD